MITKSFCIIDFDQISTCEHLCFISDHALRLFGSEGYFNDKMPRFLKLKTIFLWKTIHPSSPTLLSKNDHKLCKFFALNRLEMA